MKELKEPGVETLTSSEAMWILPCGFVEVTFPKVSRQWESSHQSTQDGTFWLYSLLKKSIDSEPGNLEFKFNLSHSFIYETIFTF